MIELASQNERSARIVVVGIGGGGGNAISTMIRAELVGVDFVSANTDSQALGITLAPARIQLGCALTKGLGAGANPEVGRKAALEQEDVIREELADADMVFVTAGMGGGTGTGAAPVIARIAKDLGALTVAVVTKPFIFEGRRRLRHAEEGLRELRGACDTLISIPNQRLIEISGRSTTAIEAFAQADDVLLQAVRGISQIITEPGLINVDFADVRTIMAEMGMAMMGAGIGYGDTRAIDAATAAISSPLLEDISIGGARGVLTNITASEDFGIQEMNDAVDLIQSQAHDDANIIVGLVHDPSLDDEVRVTVIATGFGDKLVDRLHRGAPAREYSDMTATREPEPPRAETIDTRERMLEASLEEAFVEREPAAESMRDFGGMGEQGDLAYAEVAPTPSSSYAPPPPAGAEQGAGARELPPYLDRWRRRGRRQSQ